MSETLKGSNSGFRAPGIGESYVDDLKLAMIKMIQALVYDQQWVRKLSKASIGIYIFGRVFQCIVE